MARVCDVCESREMVNPPHPRARVSQTDPCDTPGHTELSAGHADIRLAADWLESYDAEVEMPDGVVEGSRLTFTAMHEF